MLVLVSHRLIALVIFVAPNLFQKHARCNDRALGKDFLVCHHFEDIGVDEAFGELVVDVVVEAEAHILLETVAFIVRRIVSCILSKTIKFAFGVQNWCNLPDELQE